MIDEIICEECGVEIDGFFLCDDCEEEVYDETKEVYPGDIQLKLDDVDMVINKVIGTMKVSTEWEEVPWDYGYDK